MFASRNWLRVVLRLKKVHSRPPKSLFRFAGMSPGQAISSAVVQDCLRTGDRNRDLLTTTRLIAVFESRAPAYPSVRVGLLHGAQARDQALASD